MPCPAAQSWCNAFSSSSTNSIADGAAADDAVVSTDALRQLAQGGRPTR